MKLFEDFKACVLVRLFPSLDFLSGSPAADAQIGLGVHFADGYAGGFDFKQESLRDRDLNQTEKWGAALGKSIKKAEFAQTSSRSRRLPAEKTRPQPFPARALV